MLLESKIDTVEQGTAYGSSSLKAAQNQSLPCMDLLVREAIQNSSDAALEVYPGEKCVKIDFNTGNFVPHRFNALLSDVSHFLDRDFPGEEARFLEIRDSKTSGLTGPLCSEEIEGDHGNYYKLIFDTGKKQTKEKSGGNWGYGKSAYFLAGIGLVVFYSRIRNGEKGYESRLIVCCVEHEDDQRGILHRANPKTTGKAWWGRLKKKRSDTFIPGRVKNEILPLTDEKEIAEFLDIFGLAPFGDSETGTSIIIPYIDEEDLLKDVYVLHDAEKNSPEAKLKKKYRDLYARSLDDYLFLAVQRWYAPKLDNRDLTPAFPGEKILNVSINGEPLDREEMLPLFRVIQELYNGARSACRGKKYKSTYVPGFNYDESAGPLNPIDLKINSTFKKSGPCGYIAYTKKHRNDEDGPWFYGDIMELAGKSEASLTSDKPIVMYAREPGMIVNYETSGSWCGSIAGLDGENNLVLAFFVPETGKIINRSVPDNFINRSFGYYLKESEGASHEGWKDKSGCRIVKRLQANTVNKLRKNVEPTLRNPVEARPNRLSDFVGNIMLPKSGYGTEEKVRRHTSRSGGGKRSGKAEFSLEEMTFRPGGIESGFIFTLSGSCTKAEMQLRLVSEGGQITPESWQTDSDLAFPVTMDHLRVERIVLESVGSGQGGEVLFCDAQGSTSTAGYSGNGVKLHLDGSRTSAILENVNSPEKKNIKKINVYGTVLFRTTDRKCRFNFSVKTLKTGGGNV